MNDTFSHLGLDTAWLLLVAVVVLVGYRAIRWGARLIPLSNELRAMVARGLPVFGSLLFLFYLLFAVRHLLRDQPQHIPAALALVAVAVVLSAWGAIRDGVAGVMLKLGGRARNGDVVRIGEVEGRIVRQGYLGLAVETTRGEEAIVPYSELSRRPLVRAPEETAVATRVFEVRVPPGSSALQTRRRVRELALANHWSSPGRDPNVVVRDDELLEVTVYPLHASRGPDIEAAVRQSLDAPPPSRRGI